MVRHDKDNSHLGSASLTCLKTTEEKC